MKKIISAVTLCILALSMVLMLVSCSGLENGKYIGSNDAVIEISGEKIVITSADGEASEYTFEIKDNKDDSDKKDIHLTDDKGNEITYTYVERDDSSFVMGGILYKKQ